jgi:formamidopyrimidine-DNA glycosylase
MPELPEVETVKETLKQNVLNKKIKDISIYWDNIIEYPIKSEFINDIKEQTITDIKRRGKWLMFELNDYYLMSHLRMEGKFFFRTKGDNLNKHEHVVILFEDNTELRYQDTRKFGKMHLIKKEEINNRKPLIDLGLEPFDNDLTIEYLKNKYRNKKLPIKTVLLDQSIITGIGNIYANEILFLSKINPLTKANELNDNNLKDIIKNTQEVLNEAIKKGGTTIRSYTSKEGVTGLFQHELFIHGREKEQCKICNSTIEKIKVNGRGTYYCPNCQK